MGENLRVGGVGGCFLNKQVRRGSLLWCCVASRLYCASSSLSSFDIFELFCMVANLHEHQCTTILYKRRATLRLWIKVFVCVLCYLFLYVLCVFMYWEW